MGDNNIRTILFRAKVVVGARRREINRVRPPSKLWPPTRHATLRGSSLIPSMPSAASTTSATIVLGWSVHRSSGCEKNTAVPLQ